MDRPVAAACRKDCPRQADSVPARWRDHDRDHHQACDCDRSISSYILYQLSFLMIGLTASSRLSDIERLRSNVSDGTSELRSVKEGGRFCADLLVFLSDNSIYWFSPRQGWSKSSSKGLPKGTSNN